MPRTKRASALKHVPTIRKPKTKSAPAKKAGFEIRGVCRVGGDSRYLMPGHPRKVEVVLRVGAYADSIQALFDPKLWDTKNYGVIYGDDLFLVDLRRLLSEAGAPTGVGYSEAGRQTDYYVDLDAAPEVLVSLRGLGVREFSEKEMLLLFDDHAYEAPLGQELHEALGPLLERWARDYKPKCALELDLCMKTLRLTAKYADGRRRRFQVRVVKL